MIGDLGAVRGEKGSCGICPYGTVVPEPGTLALLAPGTPLLCLGAFRETGASASAAKVFRKVLALSPDHHDGMIAR
jgi:hypothetical protein